MVLIRNPEFFTEFLALPDWDSCRNIAHSAALAVVCVLHVLQVVFNAVFFLLCSELGLERELLGRVAKLKL